MSLFTPADITIATGQPAKAGSRHASGKSILAHTASLQAIHEAIGTITPNQVIKFVTHGAWSLHELVEYIVLQVGPCRAWLSTWTISEEPARCFHQLQSQGFITELHCLFDYRIHQKAPEPFQLMKSIASSIKLTKCHAKAVVLENDTWGISIVGSANLSRNRRIEAGTIFTTRADALFDRQWIQTEINRTDDTN